MGLLIKQDGGEEEQMEQDWQYFGNFLKLLYWNIVDLQCCVSFR